jgi:hypothetical protein
MAISTPGNVLMSRRDRQDKLILLDWGRARVASLVEDVSSWLQSVSYWEPECRQHHDRLLAAYLSTLGMDGSPTDSVRAAYWMAAASNALSGALLHHLHRQRLRSVHVTARCCNQSRSGRAPRDPPGRCMVELS